MKKEFPILFNTEMVKAILEGRKTQTRRVVKDKLIIEQAEFECGNRPHVIRSEPSLQYWVDTDCPFGQVGDRLWVRETTIISPPNWLAPDDVLDHPDVIKDSKGEYRVVQYIASNSDTDVPVKDYKLKKTPSIHMPRWASRILLEITGIRVERLNDISRGDAVNEGIETLMVDCSRDGLKTAYKDYTSHNNAITRNNPIDSFRTLWESVNGADSWEKNPWVWAVEFKVIQGGES